MYTVYLASAAVGGGIVAAGLGWLQSGEPWKARKFLSSALRSILAGAVFAVGNTVSPVIGGGMGIMAAFLAGAGVDVLGNRLAGSITRK